MGVDISVVIPAYNEEGNIASLLRELKAVLDRVNRSYEIIVIDDGSRDRTFHILSEIKKRERALKVIRLRKNFGQTAALSIGFKRANGDVIVVMDSDMQNDPNDIPKLLDKIEMGYDAVSGWRFRRMDPIGKIIVSRIANIFRRIITKESIHDSGCSLKAYKRKCVQNIHLYGEIHRFIPLILTWKGYKVGEVKVNHRRRKSGRTKYGVFRILKGFLDLITIKFWMQYSTRPMHLFGGLGIISFIGGFSVGAYLSWAKVTYGILLSNRPLLLLAILLMILGIQLFVLGILADIMVKSYYREEDSEQLIEGEI